MKSKSPWPPGFIPVIRFDHATGLCGGMLVVSSLNDPFCVSAEKFGSLPSAMYCFRSCGSIPSIPRMMSFWSPCQVFWHESAVATRQSTSDSFKFQMKAFKVEADFHLALDGCQERRNLWPADFRRRSVACLFK